MEATDADFPFWRFSLALYGQPGVPDLCIGLQDTFSADVNVLFYLLFRAWEGTALDSGEIARLDAAVAPWRAEVVQPLRQVRRALKRPEIAELAELAGDDALRNRVKSVELQSEKLQQRALERIGADLAGSPAADRTDAVRRVWRAYGDHLDRALPDDALDDLATALAAAENRSSP